MLIPLMSDAFQAKYIYLKKIFIVYHLENIKMYLLLLQYLYS